MTRPPGEYCIDDPIFWDLFLKKLSFCDPEFDVTVIHSLCELACSPRARVSEAAGLLSLPIQAYRPFEPALRRQR